MPVRFNKNSWREFSGEEIQIIQKEREQKSAKLRELLAQFPIEKFEYGRICPACDKPNNKDTPFCTGCAFELGFEDLERIPDNVFMDIITGVNKETKIVYEDEEILVFNDRFGVSVHGEHIDVIPRQVITDVTELTREHLPLVRRLYSIGLEHLKTRGFCERNGIEPDELENWITAGYNYPVSVKHLHLHMVLPPFKQEKVCVYPRFHGHQKIVSDLETHGRVIVYQEVPNETEGAQFYENAIHRHRSISSRAPKQQE